MVEEQRSKVFSHIVELRSISDHRERIRKAVEHARYWNEEARLSDDPSFWDSCLSGTYCIFAAAFEPFDMKTALHWARGESSALAWRQSSDWEKSELAYHAIN
jgi:hypothetical protein